MLSFLFEEYGYYPSDFDGETFSVNNWKFKMIEVLEDEKSIEAIDEYIKIIRESFNGIGAHIIRNREGKKISLYDGRKFALISVPTLAIGINEFNKLHRGFVEQNRPINLNDLLASWKERLNAVEQTGVSLLRLDMRNYKENLKTAMFFLGLCQNAIQYLIDIIEDYGSELLNASITHKRCSNMSSLDFFNPFNLIVDHPMRDFVELYRNNLIDFETVIKHLGYYQTDYKISSLFIARLLYPVNFLDLIEHNIEQKSHDIKLIFSIEKEISKIKKTYMYFRKMYNIRPIDWLEI